MSASILKEVVTLGGLALQSEDCLLRAAVHIRQEHGGLVRVLNERYFQFVVWRAILPRWHADIERATWDLTVTTNDKKHFFEMKNWRGKSGDDQLKGHHCAPWM